MKGFFTHAPFNLSKSGLAAEGVTSGGSIFAAGPDANVFAGDACAVCTGGCDGACPCCTGCVWLEAARTGITGVAAFFFPVKKKI